MKAPPGGDDRTRLVRFAEEPHTRRAPEIPLTEDEAEARLHQEGYESFRWYDVPGSSYPRHRHSDDECIWILKGEITFAVGDQEFKLGPGDRLYLKAETPHTAQVPLTAGVTYLVGRRS